MRFVVFAPGSPGSAVGRESAAVNRHLVKLGHHVITVATEAHPSEASADLHWMDQDGVSRALLEADLAVYHVGDNAANHMGAVEWLRAAPGVVCLHDFFLANLYVGVMQQRGESIEPLMESWYGADAIEPVVAAGSASEFLDAASRTPMTEWICSQAWGVIAHARWGIDRVVASCPGPVRVVPLGFEAKPDPPSSSQARSTVRLMSLGHVNPNRRIDRVISAIASSKFLRENVVYSLVGPVEPQTVLALSALARARGVRLQIVGQVDDASLAQALAESDVVIALRWPVLEAASGSVIEAMLAGKPIVVNRAGFYDELPDEVVVKVDPGAEREQLPDELERLVARPDIRKSLGEQARSFARRTFRVDVYAASLVELAEQVLTVSPFLEAERSALAQLRAWGSGADEVDQFVHSALTGLARHLLDP